MMLMPAPLVTLALHTAQYRAHNDALEGIARPRTTVMLPPPPAGNIPVLRLVRAPVENTKLWSDILETAVATVRPPRVVAR